MNHRIPQRKISLGSNWLMSGMLLIYNIVITVGLVMLLPLLSALVVTTAKRRYTFRQRMWWHRYPWQSETKGKDSQRIWVHALSVGEVQAAYPMTMQLISNLAEAEVYFTTSTITGFQTAAKLFSDQSVHLAFFPYDWIWAVRKAVCLINPTHVIITETDIWPNFLWQMQQLKVPVYLVNLRLSDRTWMNYKKFKWVVRNIYAVFDRICVQTQKEKKQLAELGIAPWRIGITGNLKIDSMTSFSRTDSVEIWRQRLKIPAGQRIIIAGSTHEGEETILYAALEPILLKNNNISLIIAPRDIERSDMVQRWSLQYHLESRLLSELEHAPERNIPKVVVVDSLGILKELYSLADIAFVGGSMMPSGGHNPLEPAFWGKPVLFGCDMRDFELIADLLTEAGGAFRIEDGDHLYSVVLDLLNHPEKAAKAGSLASDVIKKHSGSVQRTLEFLELA